MLQSIPWRIMVSGRVASTDADSSILGMVTGLIGANLDYAIIKQQWISRLSLTILK